MCLTECLPAVKRTQTDIIVAAVVVAMGIKLSDPIEEKDTQTDRLRNGFILVLGGLTELLKRSVLPHLSLGGCLWVMTGYAVYKLGFIKLQLPGVMAWSLLIGLALLSAVLVTGYVFLTSLFSALKGAATYAEEFFYELFESLKDKVRSKIDTMDEGIAKQQAKVILDNSVREVLNPLKTLRFNSVPKVLIACLLAVLTFVSRSVFLARLARISGATIHFSTIFASRATLVGALFLNMRWLATLLLCLLYALGLLWLGWDIWVIL